MDWMVETKGIELLTHHPVQSKRVSEQVRCCRLLNHTRIEPVSAECEPSLRDSASPNAGNGLAPPETNGPVARTMAFQAPPWRSRRQNTVSQCPNSGAYLLCVRNVFIQQKHILMAGGRDRDRTCDPYHVNGTVTPKNVAFPCILRPLVARRDRQRSMTYTRILPRYSQLVGRDIVRCGVER
jgi:hypothetical protein